VAFEALRDGTPRIVRNSWNFASAVDNESIEFGERYHHASGRCQSFYIFHSRNDSVLRVWYRVGDLVDFDTALGFSGPEDQLSPVAAGLTPRSHLGCRSGIPGWIRRESRQTVPRTCGVRIRESGLRPPRHGTFAQTCRPRT
jgi:hypothetical protein